MASVHVGTSLDLGVQAGADSGWAFGYHTSRVNGVDGFGWGFSTEFGGGLGGGFDVAWPLPGDGMPNQFVVEFGDASAKFEVTIKYSHGVIIGYFDKGEYCQHQ